MKCTDDLIMEITYKVFNKDYKNVSSINKDLMKLVKKAKKEQLILSGVI